MRHLAILLLLAIFMVGSILAAEEEKVWGPNHLRNNPTMTIYQETASGLPLYVSGKLSAPVVRGSEVSEALKFFDNNKGAYRIADPVKELLVKRIDEDELGMQHIRFQQYYKGLKVIGGEMVVHYNRSGELTTVNGLYEPGIDLATTPSISSGQALETARTDLMSFFGDGRPDQPELVVFPWENKNYLSWRLFLYSDNPPGRWEYFIDASSGEVIYKANRIMFEETIGTGVSVMGDPRNHIDTWYNGSNYSMIDYTRQLNNNIHGHNGQMPDGNYIRANVAGSTLPGTLAVDDDNVWDNATTQSPAVDGFVYTALFYDWVLREFGRNGYDNNGSSMLTIVNYSGEGSNNAYWDGLRIVVWSWTVGWRSLAGCPDVIAHEWGHAVTEYSSNLIYQKESGALNESFSDMIGAAFEFAHDSLDVPDWYMGENGVISGNGFRLMAYPSVFGDPEFYGTGDPNWVDVENCTPSDGNDYCGVHTNCGVGNKWFYLLSDGDEALGITVNGIGVENAMRIAYRANVYYWTAQTDYHEAAIGTYLAAMDLDPSGVWAHEVILAWNAVNVSTPEPGVTFTLPAGAPAFIEPGDDTQIAVNVAGYFEGTPAAGTGLLHYSLNGAEYISVAMTEVTTNHYTVNLPAVTCGDVLTYYFSAQEQGGQRFYYPDTTKPLQPRVATLVEVGFSDDFELDQGWTVYGTAVDGHWQRGVPAGYGYRGDPISDYDGSGQCFLTDNVYGNSDVDDGTTNLVSPAFDLTGRDAVISYARWYSNDFGDNPNTNEMHVYISDDDGDNWTLVETVGPVDQAGGDWFVHSFRVGDFVTSTSQMKLRFEVSDLTGAVVEAAVDAVIVNTYECVLYICGDADCSGAEPDIADITRMIDYLYISNTPLCEPYAADVNNSGGEPDISDITHLIGHLYIDGRELQCQNSQ